MTQTQRAPASNWKAAARPDNHPVTVPSITELEDLVDRGAIHPSLAAFVLPWAGEVIGPLGWREVAEGVIDLGAGRAGRA